MLLDAYYIGGFEKYTNAREFEEDSYTKEQVNISLNDKVDISDYSSAIIEQKLNANGKNVLDSTEYTYIGTIPNKAGIQGATTQGHVPLWGGDQKNLVNGVPIKQTISETPSQEALVSESALVEYVGNNTVSNVSGVYRKTNVISLADYEAEPPSTNEGDRYILSKSDGSFDTGSINAAWGSVLPGDVVYYESGIWKQESEQSPDEGWTIYIEDINMYAVLAVGTVTKWVIGSFAKPVDETSSDTSKTKMVSDNMIRLLNEHKDSDHFEKIDDVVNQAFIEARLTGEIASHWHPPSIDPSYDLTIQSITQNVLNYSGNPKGIKANYLLNSIACVVSESLLPSDNYEHPYSQGDRIALGCYILPYSQPVDLLKSSAFYSFEMLYNYGFRDEITFVFPEIIVITEVTVTMYINRVYYNPYIAVNGVQVSDRHLFNDGNTPSGPTLIHAYTLYEPQETDRISIQGSSISRTSQAQFYAPIKFKIAGDPVTELQYSGGLLTQPVSYQKTMPASIDMHFAAFPISTTVHQNAKGCPYIWPYENSKILKMDVYSDSASSINATINATPIFQSGVQTGSGWSYSGLVNEGANNINQGDTLEISSTGSGSNLFIRIWYMPEE